MPLRFASIADNARDLHLRYTRYFIAVIFLLSSAVSREGNAQDNSATLDRIRQNWIARFSQTRSFHYRLTGTKTHPKGKTTSEDDPELPAGHPAMPTADYSHPFTLDWSWDLNARRLTKTYDGEIFYVNARRFVPYRTQHVIHNDLIQSLTNRGHAALPGEVDRTLRQLDIYADKGSRSLIIEEELDGAMLSAHGLFFPADWEVKDDIAKLSAKYLTLTFVGQALQDQRECAVVDVTRPEERYSARRDRLWVDLERNSAVVKSQVFFNNVLFCQFDAQYAENAFGWFPRSWTSAYYRRESLQAPSEICQHFAVEVAAMSMNDKIEDSELSIARQPGLLVRDNRKPGGDRYRIGPDGETHVPLLVGTGTVNSARRIWVTGSIALFVVAMLVLYRRWRVGRSARV